MATFELVRYGCGGEGRCELDCGGGQSCRASATGDLQAAIDKARELTHLDPLNVVEVRQDGRAVCTVGDTWVSRRCVQVNEA
jgi:hypothetical protein